MTQEQYILAAQPGPPQKPGAPPSSTAGIYGWRKRCLYFLILLLLITMIVNLALTIWILKVMNFTVDGMGNLRVTKQGIHLEGVSEFLLPLYVKEIQSRKVRRTGLCVQHVRGVCEACARHVQCVSGQQMVDAQCQRFEVRSSDGKRVLFSADEEEVTVGAEKLRVTGTEGAVFQHSVETPHVRAEPFQDLKLESPTRTLTMEAPKGVEVSATVGDLKVACRKELLLQSTEGEAFLQWPGDDPGSLNLLSLGWSSSKSCCPSCQSYMCPAEPPSSCS
uniref:Sarcoglycan zeta n=1 Tax=Paramormyrops kingsleyae TaxID=1676925 RepID=A0A3B3QSN8_9TELE